MGTTGINPVLPSWEYIADGGPHVFGGVLIAFAVCFAMQVAFRST